MNNKRLTLSTQFLRIAFFGLLLSFTQRPALAQDEYYVSSAGSGTGGLSWTNAFTSLQDALAVANDGDIIYVAEGTYYPSQRVDVNDNSTLDSREETFQVASGVTLYGGFEGNESPITQTVLDSRDLIHNATILDGDLGQDGVDSNNAYHVVYTTNAATSTVIDGITIRNGNANGSGIHNQGGGWYNEGDAQESSPTLRSVRFFDNKATDGGALYNSHVGSSTSQAAVTLINCLFNDNSAGTAGGAIYAIGALSGTASLTITHCTFAGNSATEGGGIYFDEVTGGTAEAEIRNSIFWDNNGSGGGDSWHIRSGTVDVASTLVNEASESVIESGDYSGTTVSFGGGYSMIYDDDPLFADPATDNFQLKCNSPAADKAGGVSFNILPGNVTTDAAGNPRFVENGFDGDSFVEADYGAFEGVAAIYVDASATAGSNNGGSWENAYTDLQDALDESCGTTATAIYVASGTYYPSVEEDIDESGGSDPREVTFKITDKTRIYGGFAGNEMPITQSVLDNRNFTTHETILSGDLGDDDSYTVSFGASGTTITASNISDNAYHVVYAFENSLLTEIDGFTITGGNADGSDTENQRGGGIYNTGQPSLGGPDEASPTLRNLKLYRNTAARGGGLYNNGCCSALGVRANPSITNCAFIENRAVDIGVSTGSGGGMYNDGNSGGVNPVALTNCVFERNVAKFGGAISSFDRVSINYQNCIFNRNSATRVGGAIREAETTNTFTNCVFWQNYADQGGAAGHGSNGMTADFINCTFEGNVAFTEGGGIYSDGQFGTRVITVTNSIFWNNSAASGAPWFIDFFDGQPDEFRVSHTLVSASSSSTLDTETNDPSIIGAGMIYGQDPDFFNAMTGDLQLDICSPAIDAANGASNTAVTDANGEARTKGAAMDMGAYEADPAPIPEISITSSTTSDFGDTSVGTSRTIEYTITNTGGVNVQILGASVSGSTAFSAAIPSTTLTPGNSVTLTVNFAPSVTGTASSTVSIQTTNPTCNPPVLNLSGNGVPLPEISIDLDIVQLDENDGTGEFTFTFTSSVTVTADLTVAFSVSGTATFNDDYELVSGAASFTTTSGTVIIPDGQNSQAVVLRINDDATVEPDETIILTID